MTRAAAGADAYIVKGRFDHFAIDPKGKRLRHCRRRQPAFQVPAPVDVAHQDQAGASQRHGPKLKMTAKQPHPSKTGRHMLRAQKIFMPERGIFSDRHGVHVQLRNRQDPHGESAYLHGPAKRAFQVRGQIALDAVRTNQKRNANLQGDEQRHNEEYDAAVFSKANHSC